MEKRHYFEIPGDTKVNSISRISSGNLVTGYKINEDIEISIPLNEQYNLLVDMPLLQPYKGIIASNNRDINKWRIVDEMPEELEIHNSRHGSIQVNNDVYIFGGAEWLNLTDPFLFNWSKHVHKYNLISKTWTKMEDLPVFINEQRAIHKDGVIYLFGGLKKEDLAVATYSKDPSNYNMKYTIATDTFEYLPSPRLQGFDDFATTSGAVLIGDKVYIFADTIFIGPNPGTVPTNINTRPYIYDLLTETWSLGTATNTRFDRGYAIEYNGLIYVYRSLKFQAYNPLNDTWITTLTPPTYGLVHAGLLHIYGDLLLTTGGFETANQVMNGHMQTYDFINDEWKVLSKIEVGGKPLGYGTSGIYNDTIYYIGGKGLPPRLEPSNEYYPTNNRSIFSFRLADGDEIWTKDGLYLYKGDNVIGGNNINVFIKDFLENIPNIYQSKKITNLTNLDKEAEYLINNNPTPKEFHVISSEGIQDQIVAYINNKYYINSPNEYVPYRIDNIYGTTWEITDTIYDQPAKTAGLISNGMRKDMILKSNKLMYVMKYEGMLESDTTPYLENGLVYLNNTEIDGQWYQVYINLKYIYNSSGYMSEPLIESSWQTITITDAFLHEDLTGKVLKVW